MVNSVTFDAVHKPSVWSVGLLVKFPSVACAGFAARLIVRIAAPASARLRPKNAKRPNIALPQDTPRSAHARSRRRNRRRGSPLTTAADPHWRGRSASRFRSRGQGHARGANLRRDPKRRKHWARRGAGPSERQSKSERQCRFVRTHNAAPPSQFFNVNLFNSVSTSVPQVTHKSEFRPGSSGGGGDGRKLGGGPAGRRGVRRAMWSGASVSLSVWEPHRRHPQHFVGRLG